MPWPKPSEARRCSSGSPSSRRTTSRKQHELMYVSSARLWTEGWCRGSVGLGRRGFAHALCGDGPGRSGRGRPAVWLLGRGWCSVRGAAARGAMRLRGSRDAALLAGRARGVLRGERARGLALV